MLHKKLLYLTWVDLSVCDEQSSFISGAPKRMSLIVHRKGFWSSIMKDKDNRSTWMWKWDKITKKRKKQYHKLKVRSHSSPLDKTSQSSDLYIVFAHHFSMFFFSSKSENIAAYISNTHTITTLPQQIRCHAYLWLNLPQVALAHHHLIKK